jgi:hypothetical protein
MIGKEKWHEECHMKEKCLKYDICSMILVQKIVFGKWKILILRYLSYSTLRFNDIKKRTLPFNCLPRPALDLAAGFYESVTITVTLFFIIYSCVAFHGQPAQGFALPGAKPGCILSMVQEPIRRQVHKRN